MSESRLLPEKIRTQLATLMADGEWDCHPGQPKGTYCVICCGAGPSCCPEHHPDLQPRRRRYENARSAALREPLTTEDK